MKKFENFRVLLVANDSSLMTNGLKNFKSGLYPELFKIFHSLFGSTKICFCDETSLYDINNIQDLTNLSNKSIKKKISFEYFFRILEFIFGRNLYIEKLRYKRILKNLDYSFDIVISISSTTNSGVLASLISKEHRKPYIILEHMTYYQRDIIKFWHKKLLKQVQSSAELIAPVSSALEKILKKFNPAIKSIVVHNPIGNEMFEDPSSELTSRLKDFSQGSFCFGAWTVWRDIKRLDLLLNAFDKLNLKSEHKCKLIIGGKYVNDKLILRMKNNEDILFLGALKRKETHALSAFVDCCVVPSDHETFGLPIAEALSQGTPVISTKCGGIEELIDHSMGIVINRGDELSLINAMNLIIKRKDFSNEKIKQFAEKHFSSSEIKERWSKILSNLLLEKNDKKSSL